MKLEQTVRFRMDFRKPWAQYSAALMGLFVFLRAVYFFGFLQMTDGPLDGLWLHVIIPLTVGILYIVLLRGVQLNIPVVYAGIGAVCCVLMIVLNLRHGASFWSVLSVIFYIAAALLMLVTVLGFLPNRLYMTAAFAAATLLQFLAGRVWSYVTGLQVAMLLRQLSDVFVPAALACLAPAMAGRRLTK